MWVDTKDSIEVFPVRPLHFALYLQRLGLQSQSKAAVEEATNAVSWFSQAAGLVPMKSDPFIKTVLAGLQRSLAKPKVIKEPVTPTMLREMVDSFGAKPSLSDLRIVAIAVTAFTAFLRFDKIVKIRCCVMDFLSNHMVLKIRSSKTNQYRQGDEGPLHAQWLS